VTRRVAGVFGRAAEDVRPVVRSAFGTDASGEATTAGLTVAWTGPPPDASGMTVVLAGALRNLRSLAAELGATGSSSPERVLELAFARWGEDVLPRLRGSFVLAMWDPRRRTGLLAVDHLGVGGLYLHESHGQLIFATELLDLGRMLPSRPAPASRSVVQWLADGYLESGETLWDGVRRLEGGHLVRLEGDRWRTAPYWSPRYQQPERIDVHEATSRLGAALAGAVRDRMAPTGTTGVLLSGGLDSSAVAAFARSLDPPGGPLKAYTHVYPEHPEMDESRLVELTASALAIPWEPQPAPIVGTLPAAFEFQLAWEVPPATPMLAFTQPLLERAARDGVSVMLDGEGGDELFDCSPYLIADRLRRGRLREAMALVRRLPDAGPNPSRRELLALAGEYGLKGAAPHSFHRTIRRLRRPHRYAAPWLTAPGARLYVEARDEWAWKRRAGPLWWSFLANLLTSWREQMGAYDFFRQRDTLAGIETRHPLLDDVDLIEVVLRLPPDLSFDPELTRPLERELLAGVLPDEIRLRRDKSTFGELVIEALGGPDLPLVTSLLEAPDAELWAYANPDSVRALLEVPAGRRSLKWAHLLWRLATTESWLRAQADREFPARMLERSRSAVTGGPLAHRAPRRVGTS
jgi:asparagine synthase (glutamine-hydrolysing)